jgi:hypothetical protein
MYSTRYPAAAIFGSGMMGWRADNFQALLVYLGPNLTYWSIAALILGLGTLLWSEVEAIWNSKQ